MDESRNNNAEERIANTMRGAGEAAASAAQRVSDSFDQGRAALADVQAIIADRARECVQSTETYVRDNPWQAMAMAGGIGLVIGLLLGRR